MNIVLYLLGKLYYVTRNKKKTQKWESLTDQVRILCLMLSAVADNIRKRSNISRPPVTLEINFSTLDSSIRYDKCMQIDSFASVSKGE
jgi:hypothetical protein